MNILNSKVYQWLEVATNYLILNLIWLLCCIPIVTIFPATAAMFGVVRQWKIKKDAYLMSTFFRMFKENFKQSFLIGLLWIVIAFILYIDFRFTQTVGSSMKMVLYPFFFLISLILGFITVYLFPVMVHYKTNWFGVIKNALILSIGNLFTTILILVVMAIFGVILMVVPATALIIFSVLAQIIYALCHRGFEKVARLAEQFEEAS